ncbi:MAG: transposase [Xenococcaceae cyanobacterium MO_207.B15]|nr:transposase [Xenococcaceae cyanobacterium MO_207.B15]
MARPYSKDLRIKVLEAYQQGEGTQQEIAERFQVSLSFVRDLMRRYRETGDVKPKGYKGGRAPKLDIKHIQSLKLWVNQHDDISLQELQTKLNQEHGIKVSLSTVYRRLQDMNQERQFSY